MMRAARTPPRAYEAARRRSFLFRKVHPFSIRLRTAGDGCPLDRADDSSIDIASPAMLLAHNASRRGSSFWRGASWTRLASFTVNALRTQTPSNRIGRRRSPASFAARTSSSTCVEVAAPGVPTSTNAAQRRSASSSDFGGFAPGSDAHWSNRVEKCRFAARLRGRRRRWRRRRASTRQKYRRQIET
jgi:hypothetical protein